MAEVWDPENADLNFTSNEVSCKGKLSVAGRHFPGCTECRSISHSAMGAVSSICYFYVIPIDQDLKIIISYCYSSVKA